MSVVGQPLESFIDLDKYNDAAGTQKDRGGSLLDFFKNVRLCLLDYQQRLGMDEDNFVRFIHEDPPIVLTGINPDEEDNDITAVSVGSVTYPQNISRLDLTDSSIITDGDKYGEFSVVKVYDPYGVERLAGGDIGRIVLKNNSIYTMEVTSIYPDCSGVPVVNVQGEVEPDTHVAIVAASGSSINQEASIVYHGQLLNSNLYNTRAVGDDLVSAQFKPTIAYSLKLKEPGTSGQGGPFGGTREYKPRVRTPQGYTLSNNAGDRCVTEYGQKFDCLVQFDVWAETHTDAEELADWLEDFITKYAGVFEKNGLDRIMFWQRLRDGTKTAWRDNIVSRSLIYFIRYDQTSYVDLGALEYIDYIVTALTDIEKVTPSGSTYTWVSANTLT